MRYWKVFKESAWIFATALMAALPFLLVLAMLVASASAEICVPGAEVTVKWTANTESDLAGYELFRGDKADGTFTKVHAGLIAGTEHTETALAEGTWFYKLKAVDTCGNRSGFSDASEAVRIDTTPPAAPGAITIVITIQG